MRARNAFTAQRNERYRYDNDNVVPCLFLSFSAAIEVSGSAARNEFTMVNERRTSATTECIALYMRWALFNRMCAPKAAAGRQFRAWLIKLLYICR